MYIYIYVHTHTHIYIYVHIYIYIYYIYIYYIIHNPHIFIFFWDHRAGPANPRSYKDVLPHFQCLERVSPDYSEARGKEGPIAVAKLFPALEEVGDGWWGVGDSWMVEMKNWCRQFSTAKYENYHFFWKYVNHELGHPDWNFHYKTSGLVAIGMWNDLMVTGF